MESQLVSLKRRRTTVANATAKISTISKRDPRPRPIPVSRVCACVLPPVAARLSSNYSSPTSIIDRYNITCVRRHWTMQLVELPPSSHFLF